VAVSRVFGTRVTHPDRVTKLRVEGTRNGSSGGPMNFLRSGSNFWHSHEEKTKQTESEYLVLYLVTMFCMTGLVQ
jgi:hypothetical protein